MFTCKYCPRDKTDMYLPITLPESSPDLPQGEMMNDFVDLSNEAVVVAYQIMAVTAYLAVVLFMIRLALTHRLFTKQALSKKVSGVISLVVTIFSGTVTVWVAQVPVVGIGVVVASIVVMACLVAPALVRKTWHVLDEVFYQTKRLCVMQGRAFIVWKATI